MLIFLEHDRVRSSKPRRLGAGGTIAVPCVGNFERSDVVARVHPRPARPRGEHLLLVNVCPGDIHLF